MEPCDDGSTVNDAADLIASLEAEFNGDDGSDGAAGVSALAGVLTAAAAALAL